VLTSICDRFRTARLLCCKPAIAALVPVTATDIDDDFSLEENIKRLLPVFIMMGVKEIKNWLQFKEDLNKPSPFGRWLK